MDKKHEAFVKDILRKIAEKDPDPKPQGIIEPARRDPDIKPYNHKFSDKEKQAAESFVKRLKGEED